MRRATWAAALVLCLVACGRYTPPRRTTPVQPTASGAAAEEPVRAGDRAPDSSGGAVVEGVRREEGTEASAEEAKFPEVEFSEEDRGTP